MSGGGVLPAQEIRRQCLYADGRLREEPLVFPFLERTRHNGVSHGLGACTYDVRLAEDIWVWPWRFFLASTIEYFRMPLDLCATPMDKSTWIRIGLRVHNTHLDPGWFGYLTLELGKDWKWPWVKKIHKGTAIAQIKFERLTAPTEQPYEGKYQDQAAGPQMARWDK